MDAPIAHDLLDRLDTGLALLCADGQVVWVNDALAELLGSGARSLRGHGIASVLDDANLVAVARASVAGGQAVTLRAVGLTPLRGEPLIADLAVQALDDGHLLLEVHALATQVGKPTPLSATLRGFAHEVKNPLAGLRGAAQLLQRRVTETDLAALCEVLLAETDRLTTLADHLLQQRGPASLGEVNLHEILERVATLLAGETTHVRLLQDYDPSLPALVGDADRLHQLVLNLARNALEAGAGMVILRTRIEHGVHLHQQMARTVVRVDVADNGVGVADSVRESLFEPLVSGRENGTGLGLALAREIAHEHGGELRHVSHPGATVFSLYLPLERVL